MPKVTFELTPDLKKLMDAHPNVNWSSVFREAIRRQARVDEIAREILEEEADPRIQALAARLKEAGAKRLREAVRARRR